MKKTQSLRKRIAVCSAVLLCCTAFLPVVSALDGEDPRLSLRIEGDSVSADLRAEPLAQVAQALENMTGIAIHLQASGLKDQAITARFENLALRAALKEILRHTSYAVVGEPGEPDTVIRVFVYSLLPGIDPKHRPTGDKIDSGGNDPVPGSELTESNSEDPTDLANLPHLFDPDPAVRISELGGAVAAHGSESIALILAAAHDPDANVRHASEELLLNDLRDLVPKESLATMAGRSERAETRLLALEALADRRGDLHYTRMALDGALYDSDPEVRQRAKDLLLELGELDTVSTTVRLQGTD